MLFSNKKEMEENLGKYGFFSSKNSNILINKMKYLNGIEDFDNLEKKVSLDKASTGLRMRPNGIEIAIFYGLSTRYLGILYEDIKHWSVENQEVIIKQSKSVLGRAAIGGLLLGSVGAIVGGMSGLGTKDVKISKNDNIIFICCKNNDKDYIISFSCDSKHIKTVYNYLDKNLPNKYKKLDDIKDEK